MDTPTPPGSMPSSPMGYASHFNAFPFSPLTPDSDVSPVRPSYSGALMSRDTRTRQQLFHPSASQVEQDLLGGMGFSCVVVGRSVLCKGCL